jgi:hypothetical protein
MMTRPGIEEGSCCQVAAGPLLPIHRMRRLAPQALTCKNQMLRTTGIIREPIDTPTAQEALAEYDLLQAREHFWVYRQLL